MCEKKRETDRGEDWNTHDTHDTHTTQQQLPTLIGDIQCSCHDMLWTVGTDYGADIYFCCGQNRFGPILSLRTTLPQRQQQTQSQIYFFLLELFI
jgi:hypothetical protein